MKKKTTYVKIRNKKYDKLIASFSTVIIFISILLLLVLNITEAKVDNTSYGKFTGFNLLTGTEKVESSIYFIVTVSILFISLILNIIGIFNKKYSLFSGLILIIAAILTVFISNTQITTEALDYLVDVKFKSTFVIYISVAFSLISALMQLYITINEDFSK